ncbi:MAG: ABC transporter permease, partial [Actinobacteria bacterium]|nr:ABC transporter permease [Actinomycetota bacterium]
MAATQVDSGVAVPLDLLAPAKRSLLRDAWGEVRAIARYRHLLRLLVSSSLRTENSNTVFGFFWWVLDPLLQMAVYVIFIGVLLSRGGPDYPIFILTAIISWELLVKATQGSAAATLRKERAMRQVAFPKAILPLSEVIGAGAHFVFAFGVLLIVAVPFGIYPSASALLVIPIALVQLTLTTGIALFISALNVFFRDTTRIITYVFRMGFFLSPALYPASIVPDRFRPIYDLNPFVTLFDAYR